MPTNNINSSKYLSLKTAAELYGYTRDHLGLMIRKGKLKGLKLGSYYVTTSDWMAEYVKNFADLNHPISKSKLSNKFLNEILTIGRKINTPPVLEEDKSQTINNNKNKSLKSIPKIGPKTDFEKEISEELSKLPPSLKYPAQIGDKFRVDSPQKDVNFKNYEFKIDIDRHYVVLPLREMEINERENILNKISNKKIEKV